MTSGFYKRRRGILEHIEAGTIDLLESGIHDYLNLKANLLIGSDSAIPVGFVFTSAPAIHAHCKRVSERTIQRILEHLEEIGWIKTFRAPNQRGNYLSLICRASVHDLSGNEYRINASATTDWRHPVYEPVGQLSPETGNVVLKVAGLREERAENRERRKKQSAATAAAAQPVAFQSGHLTVTQSQDLKLADVYPWVNRPHEYGKMALWLEANRPGQKIRNALAFCQNWFNKIPCPSKGGPRGKTDINEAVAITMQGAAANARRPN
jgi:hypothetical protein